jgi:mannose-6-phosphate isomerase-like protein (cupin superfamily)
VTSSPRQTTSAPALAAAAAGGFSAVERTLRRGEMTPLHVHGHDEAYHVVEGELTLHAGTDIVWLDAGASYVVAAGVPHAHRAESDRVCVRTATVVASAARYDDFARAAAVPSEAAPTPEDGAALAAIAAANGIVVLGLPGTTPAGEAAAA